MKMVSLRNNDGRRVYKNEIIGNTIGKSRVAAAKGITQVVISRIIMAAPGMMVLPVIMEKLERYNWFKRISILHGPIQITFVGCL